MFDEVFYYDETSPTCLRWKKAIFSGKSRNVTKVISGDVAGSIKINKRHSQVQYGNKNYMVHRIIWELFHGEIENGYVIDHIDGNEQNNNIDNLRKVTLVENSRNCCAHSDNTSGVTGVSFTCYKGCSYWVASWRSMSGKMKQKCYSVKRLGEELAFFCACEKRELEILKLNLSGAGYTERHGK